MSDEKALTVSEGNALRSGGSFLTEGQMQAMWTLAQTLAKSPLLPTSYIGTRERRYDPEQVAANVFLAIGFGYELGFSPFQSIQNLAVINNRPSLYGEAIMSPIYASGLLEGYEKSFTGSGDTLKCVVKLKRKGIDTPFTGEFSVADAKQAGLYNDPKRAPWKLYTKDMLLAKARARAAREGFADVLKGVQSGEDMEDVMVELRPGEYVKLPEGEPPAPPEAKQPEGKAPATPPAQPQDPPETPEAPEAPEEDYAHQEAAQPEESGDTEEGNPFDDDAPVGADLCDVTPPLNANGREDWAAFANLFTQRLDRMETPEDVASLESVNRTRLRAYYTADPDGARRLRGMLDGRKQELAG